jgi:hypothetical protein
MSAATDFSAGRTEQKEYQSDQGHHDSNTPDDGNLGEKTDEHQNKADYDHSCLLLIFAMTIPTM